MASFSLTFEQAEADRERLQSELLDSNTAAAREARERGVCEERVKEERMRAGAEVAVLRTQLGEIEVSRGWWCVEQEVLCRARGGGEVGPLFRHVSAAWRALASSWLPKGGIMRRSSPR